MNQDKCWDYYQTEGVDSFDQTYPRLRYLVRLLAAFKKRSSERQLRVLNVGVGNGIFEELCVKAGYDVWCLDPAEKAVKQLEEKITVHGVVGKIHDANLPADFFAAINMSEVLEHLSDSELQQAIQNVNRMLIPGGLFVGTVPYQENLQDNKVVCPHCGEIFHRWGHQQSFKPERLRRLLQDRFPMVNVWVRPFVAWRKLNWKGKALGAFQVLLSFLGIHGINENIVFYARKA